MLDLPEQAKQKVMLVRQDVRVADNIDVDISRFSSLKQLLRVVARILALKKEHSLKVVFKELNSDDLKEAWSFLIKREQELLKSMFHKGNFNTLGAVYDKEGLLVVGSRVGQAVPLLPKSDFVNLIVKEEHEKGHLGVLATSSKVRVRVWVCQLNKIVRSFLKKCYKCRIFNKVKSKQLMGAMPDERIQQSLPFSNVCLDLFGPLQARPHLKRSLQVKLYGLIVTCLFSRAVYLDLIEDYSSEGFLRTFRRYASIRGFPSVIYSDSGTQLVGANREIQKATTDLNEGSKWEEVDSRDLRWEFSPDSAPWRQGCAESLVSSVKTSLHFAF